jgi:hypothetical protein
MQKFWDWTTLLGQFKGTCTYVLTYVKVRRYGSIKIVIFGSIFFHVASRTWDRRFESRQGDPLEIRNISFHVFFVYALKTKLRQNTVLRFSSTLPHCRIPKCRQSYYRISKIWLKLSHIVEFGNINRHIAEFRKSDLFSDIVEFHNVDRHFAKFRKFDILSNILDFGNVEFDERT